MENSILQSIAAKLARYSAEMVAGCNAALDKGLFYTEEFNAAVIEHMGGFGVEPVLNQIADVPNDALLRTHGEIDKELCNAIKVLPRGHYGLIRWRPEAIAEFVWQVRASDGTGAIASGGSYDHYHEKPTGVKVLERMIGYEIYSCRHHLEDQRRVLRDIEAIKTYNMHVGMTFKNLRLAGYGTYSTAVIKAVHPDTGGVELLLSKRGTKNKWEGNRGAFRLAQDAGLVQSKSELELVVGKTADSLF